MSFDSNPAFDIAVVGTISALNGAVELDPLQKDSQFVSVTGTWVGTLSFEISADGVTWYAANTANLATGAMITTTTANGSFLVQSVGATSARVRASAFTSGTIAIANEGSNSVQLNTVIQSNPASLNGRMNLRDSSNIEIGTVGNPINVSSIPSSDRIGAGALGALNATISVNSQGTSSVTFQLSGTWVGTVSTESTLDGITWFTSSGIDRQTELRLSSTTTNRIIQVFSSSYAQTRVKMTSYTSGSASVTYTASAGATVDPSTNGNVGATAPLQSQLVGGLESATGFMRPLAVDLQGRLVTSAITGFGADFTFGDVTLAAITRALVRRTAYTEQTTNAQRSISSASASDAAAGTGARTIQITYLDATGAGPFNETLALNGVTFVNTVATNMCFIEEIKVLTAGSSGSNTGILTLKSASAGGGVIIGTINALDNQTFWAHHYIPTGKECNITGISCGHNGTTVGSGALFTINATTIGLSGAIDRQVTDFVRLYGQSSTFARNYVSPIKVLGPARIQVWCTPETSTSIIYRTAVDFFEP